MGQCLLFGSSFRDMPGALCRRGGFEVRYHEADGTVSHTVLASMQPILEQLEQIIYCLKPSQNLKMSPMAVALRNPSKLDRWRQALAAGVHLAGCAAASVLALMVLHRAGGSKGAIEGLWPPPVATGASTAVVCSYHKAH